MADYITQLLVYFAAYGLAASGLNLVTGYGGMFSLAHGFYFGLGAYGFSILTVDHQWSVTTALIAAVVMSGIAGGVVALPALRLRGDYLVIASLAIQMVGYSLYQNWGSLTHGSEGIFGIPFYDLYWTGLGRNESYAVLCLLLLTVALLIVWRLVRSPWGKVLRAIREDEIAAASVGKHVTRTKVASWSISAAMAALGGALYAGFVGFIDPDTFDIRISIMVLTMVLIGGAGTLLGPLLGAVVVVGLPEIFRNMGLSDNLNAQVSLIMMGLLLAAFMLLRPRGLVGPKRPRPAQPDSTSAEEIPGGSVMVGEGAVPSTGVVAMTSRAGSEQDGPARASDVAGLAAASSAPSPVSLAVNDVSMQVNGRQILAGVSFQAPPAEVVALIGPNGAGKSSLLDVITGFTPRSGGRVSLGAKHVQRARPEQIAREGIVRVFQEQRVFGQLSVLDNVLIGLQRVGRETLLGAFDLRPSTRRADRASVERAVGLLNLFNLAHKRHEKAGSLSGGQQRLVGIARAVAAEPAVLLLDEPCAGVSERLIETLKSVVRDISAAGPRAVVVVEHNTEFVRDVADKVVFLDRGKVLREGDPGELFADDELSRVYFGVTAQERDMA